MDEIIFYFSFCKLNCPSTSKIWTKMSEIIPSARTLIIFCKKDTRYTPNTSTATSSFFNAFTFAFIHYARALNVGMNYIYSY